MRSLSELQGRGDTLLTGWAARVEGAGGAELEELAGLLTNEARGRDLALWIPLLARWSEADGAAMIAFLEAKAPPALRDKLLGQAWFAWGASDPDAAFAAGRNKPVWAAKLLAGIAETDPRKAVDCLWQLPNAQFLVAVVSSQVIRKAPELADEVLSRAVYDGGRMPLQAAMVSDLAAKDPAQAVALAKRWGNVADDPVSDAIREIARHDPAKAAEQVALMPSNRTKALSSVALAKVWAATDPEAATAWIRGNLTGPAKHYALVNAAAASGGADPERALALLKEAGTDPGGDFFTPFKYGITPSDSYDKPDVHLVGVDLLRRVAASDPEKARRLAEGQWKEWAVEAGIKP